MSTQPKPLLTEQEYLAIERQAEFKSEFFRGEMFAMAGASRQHNQIVSNVIREIGNALKDSPCEIYPSDLRVKIGPSGLYTYPDAVIVCGEGQFEDEHVDTLLNPTVMIEVLSESTASYDRGSKVSHYRKLDSVQGYVLIAQDRPSVESYVRQSSGGWLLQEATSIEETAFFCAMDVRVPMSEIYRNVRFDDGEEEQTGLSPADAPEDMGRPG